MNNLASNKNNIQDLQIYLTRSPGQQPVVHQGIPSFIITGEGRPTSRRVFTTVPEDLLDASASKPELSYIAIANSSAIEGIGLPFSPEAILDVTRRLTANGLTYVESMRFGASLFNFAINGTIRDLYRKLHSQGNTLRLTIATSLPELAVLPWELLCDVRSGSFPKFLCHQTDIRFCRSLQLFDRAGFKTENLGEANDQLRILFVTANPSLVYLDFGTEERQLRFVIDEPPALGKVELYTLNNADINALRDALIKYKPHILHLSCHGGYDDAQNLGFVVLSSPNNIRQPDYVNSYRLASVVQEAGSVKLALISSCYGAYGSDLTAFSGIAQLLHASGIEDVVALNYSVFDTTTHSILLNFYRYLLREGLTVEECISKVRRFLFINGYPLNESFGLTLYQSNVSLWWKGFQKISIRSEDESEGFNKFVQQFEATNINDIQLTERLSDILPNNIIKEVESLPSVELYLAITVFGDLEVAVEIIRKIRATDVPLDLFLKMAQLVKVLCHRRLEKNLLRTAFIIGIEKNPKEYIEKHPQQVSQLLTIDLFNDQISAIVEEAFKVNGEDRAFMILFQKGKHEVSSPFIYSLTTISDNEIGNTVSIGDPKWAKVSYIVQGARWGFILPGDARIKLISESQQVAEYKNGIWKLTDFSKLRRKVIDLSRDLSLNEGFMVDIVNKCIYASEIGRGLTLILQRRDEVLSRSHPGFKSVTEDSDLRKRNVTEFKQMEYLDRTYGDNAVIIDMNGYTIATNVALAPSSTTQVRGIPGTGSRHLSAQKITKETDAVAIVVSHDGPITIFRGGDVEERVE